MVCYGSIGGSGDVCRNDSTAKIFGFGASQTSTTKRKSVSQSSELCTIGNSLRSNSKNQDLLKRILSHTPTADDMKYLEKCKAERRKKEENIMNTKKASTGQTYAEAKKIVMDLHDKYKKSLSKRVPDPTGAFLWKTEFTTENMTPEDKAKLAQANQTMTELEKKYNLRGDGYTYAGNNLSLEAEPPTDAARIIFTNKNSGYTNGY